MKLKRMHVISRGTVKFQTIIGVFAGCAVIVPYANLTISRAKVSHVCLVWGLNSLRSIRWYRGECIYRECTKSVGKQTYNFRFFARNQMENKSRDNKKMVWINCFLNTLIYIPWQNVISIQQNLVWKLLRRPVVCEPPKPNVQENQNSQIREKDIKND